MELFFVTLKGMYMTCVIWLLVTTGSLRSETVKVDDKNIVGRKVKGVIEFLGIPYAEKPTAELRFKPPEYLPLSSLAVDTLSATRSGKLCMQDDDWLRDFRQPDGDPGMDEDCLTLNIFIPFDQVPASADKNVMVGIHGGKFQEGGSIMFDGRRLANTTGVIVVTFNYRLNILGFFTTGDDVVPGNMGLMDQSVALQWVQRNIGHFGGDKNAVTIFGPEAGGDSVSLQVMSPMATGLFQRAISASGFEPKRRYMSKEDWKEISKEVTDSCEGDILDCLKNDKEGFLKDLRTKVTEKGLALLPLIDGEDGFLPESPATLLSEVKYNNVEYLAGITANDYLMLNYTEFSSQGNWTADEVNGFLRKLPLPDEDTFGADLKAIVMNQYFPDLSDPESNMKGARDLLTDKFFLAPTLNGLRYISAISPAYLYYVTQSQDVNKTLVHDGYGRGTDNSSIALLSAWKKFAIEGIPVSGAKTHEPGNHYISLNGETGDVSFEQRLRPQGDSFWNNVMAALTDPDVCEDDSGSSFSKAGAETALFLLLLATISLIFALFVICANTDFSSPEKAEAK